MKKNEERPQPETKDDFSELVMNDTNEGLTDEERQAIMDEPDDDLPADDNEKGQGLDNLCQDLIADSQFTPDSTVSRGWNIYD